jgi:hypothetical protein
MDLPLSDAGRTAEEPEEQLKHLLPGARSIRRRLGCQRSRAAASIAK